jgi:hypothetical protein
MGVACSLSVVFACGDNKPGANPDASRPDASPDAPPPLPVKVTVLSKTTLDGAPDATAQVTFQDPSGATVFEGQVDAMGKLEAPLPAGGSVTAIRVTSDTATQLSADITTITGVIPGDDLTFGRKAAPLIRTQGNQTTMTVNYTPFPGASSHTFLTTCQSASTGTTPQFTLSFRDSCRGSTFDLLIVASLPPPQPLRYVLLKDIPHQDGGTITVPDSYASNDSPINTLNVPAEVSSLTVARNIVMKNFVVGGFGKNLGDPPAGTVTADVIHVPEAGLLTDVRVSTRRSDASGTQDHTLRRLGVASPVDVDLNQQQVPWLTNLASTKTGVTWTTAVSAPNPDGMITRWEGNWTDGTRTTTIKWSIVHPGSATGIALPRLSPRRAALDPQAQTVAVTPTTGAQTAVAYDVVDGYDEFRQQPETLILPSSALGVFTEVAYQSRIYSVPLPAAALP